MSRLLLDVVPGLADRESVVEALSREVAFEQWFHKGGALPRLCAEQGEMQERCRPIYRHPIDSVDEPGALPTFTPTVARIKANIEEVLKPCRFNHCLIQLYRSGSDSISEHADKSLDIAQDSVIVNYSVGATRTLILRKKNEGGGEQELAGRGGEEREDTRRFALPHNSIFVLSLEMNRGYTHQIKTDKRAPRDKALDEMGVRISLTFRSIATFFNLQHKILFGQGAPRRVEEEAADETVESRRLLQAFRDENKTSKTWQELYGGGFSLVSMAAVKSGYQTDSVSEDPLL